MDLLYLVWKNSKTDRCFIIGSLKKDSEYVFTYGYDIDIAISEGFKLEFPFIERDKIYKSKTLFSSFKCRVPDEKRDDIDEILSKYNMTTYDAFELLKRGSFFGLDNLALIDSLLYVKESVIKRFIRVKLQYNYYSSIHIKFNSQVYVILDNNNNVIGNLPDYYTKGISNLIKNGYKIEVRIDEIMPNNSALIVLEGIKNESRNYVHYMNVI